MELSLEELQLILETLSSAQTFLYNDLDAICDDEYREEAENVLQHIDNSIEIIAKHLHSKHDSL